MDIVYVITNAEMPGLVKIGRTNRAIQDRLRELDSTGVPVPFECVAAWEFDDAANAEMTIHRAFADRRVRKSREFFRVSPDQPIAILEGFGQRDVTPQDDVVNEQNADDDRASLVAARRRRENFRFDMVDIKPDAILTSIWDKDVTCTVVDKRRIQFRGKVTILSAAALTVLRDMGKSRRTVSGPNSWRYGNKTLATLYEEAYEEVMDVDGIT